jgi:hypothetical protein
MYDAWVARYNTAEHEPPPRPLLNGGLYTGEPFATGAPWANVPVIPDAGYMTHVALRSAGPPPGAIYQYPGVYRPGNSYSVLPGVHDMMRGVYCGGVVPPPRPAPCGRPSTWA